jgi:hypothetical protein
METKGQHKMENVCNEEVLALSYKFQAYCFAEIFTVQRLGHSGIIRTSSLTYGMVSNMQYATCADGLRQGLRH